ncbi:hypothetical protein [Photobacterium carnosum]|uniref:hypothetical protein n=1 Tax=Photobacterium carnosum TaxID=2023717 RepID=UPI001E33B02E|nr:hypothetical protein [Photobacterium carnosum]MCD9528766.1 hypothetical protein [Photobacterium carnosum]MCF2152645.1 hypothetical protein [Photobacterium carnosum]MCF2214405.1 hypothetical protein [Photobacterium carnosum]
MIVIFVFFCIMTVVSYVYLLMSFENKEKRLSFDDKTKTVFCDGDKVISVRDGSGNYRFIKYIFEHIDKPISVTDLETNVFFGQNVNIVKVLSNTHLPKEIINTFFCVSKNSLIFKNKAFLK